VFRSVRGAIVTLFVGTVAFAGDSYPTRPIRLVVGFGAGGPTDIPARFIADRLASLLGQNVVVENKPGAGGMLATRDVNRVMATICCCARTSNRSTPCSTKIHSTRLAISLPYR
jgi:tripartite-type tricarboxylate transporter receptor subunit TctC